MVRRARLVAGTRHAPTPPLSITWPSACCTPTSPIGPGPVGHRSTTSCGSACPASVAHHELQEAADMAERTRGGVGTKVLYENERVRIWNLRWTQGEESEIPRHVLPHVLVQIAGDRIGVVPEPDTEGPYRRYFAA